MNYICILCSYPIQYVKVDIMIYPQQIRVEDIDDKYRWRFVVKVAPLVLPHIHHIFL